MILNAGVIGRLKEREAQDYINFMERVLALACKNCKASNSFLHIGKWKVKCNDCQQCFKVKVPKHLAKDMSNPNNWRSTCDVRWVWQKNEIP
jgi:hypothetical protein